MIAINIDGKIKTFSEYPKTWNNSSPYQYADTHYEDGFRDFVTPTNLTVTQKLGEKIFDAVNDVFTHAIVNKSAVELEQETANTKEAKRQDVKQKYLDIIAEDKIALSPADSLLYFKEWVAGIYKIDARVTYKGKPFRNTVEGNINAPDKGGWIEIK